MDHVVVIDGSIEWDAEREPEIEIVVDPNVLESRFDKVDARVHKLSRKFRIGTVKPRRLLFASPGITLADLSFADLKEGELRDLQFLVRVWGDGESDSTGGAMNGTSGKFIFSFGKMMTSHSLILEDVIPDDGVESANALIAHINRLDHRLQNNKQNKPDMATPRKPSD